MYARNRSASFEQVLAGYVSKALNTLSAYTQVVFAGILREIGNLDCICIITVSASGIGIAGTAESSKCVC